MKMQKIAIQGLDITKDVARSKKDYKSQQRELQRYVKTIPSQVNKLFQQGKAIYDEIKTQIEGRNSGTVLRQRRRAWMKRVDEIQGLEEFYSHIAGEDSKTKVARIICDMVSGQMLLKDGKKRLVNWATNYYKTQDKEEKQSEFDESGYGEELLAFLPPQVYFDLGPNRELLAIKESFGREQKNWEIMSKKVAYIAKHFNEMVKDIKNDLNSGDEVTKLLALMMAITIETGLRPGALGNQATVVDQNTGKKITIDTFGVTTLQANHIKNIRDGFAELEFIGKKGGTQIATLTDSEIVAALQNILSNMSLDGSSGMLFVTKSGQHIGDYEMRKYVRSKWQDISPTDFRKYVATRSFYSYVKQATEDFRLKLLDSIAEGKDLLEEEIVNGVVQVMNDAIESTKSVLSHKEGHEAWHSYISPKVIMAYLATGGLDNTTLEEILIDNKNVRFSFDFREFTKFADGLK